MLQNQKILFIQTAFPGDAFLTLPAIQMLKKTNPDCSIDVLCIPKTKEIFDASKAVDNVIVLDKRGKHKSLFQTYQFSKKLSETGYTRVYSAHRSLRTSLLVLNLHVVDSFGFDNSALMHVYKNLIPYYSDKHEVQRNLDLIEFEYDDDSWKIKPLTEVSTEGKEKVKNFIDQNKLNDGFIAVAPASIWETKIYPADYYVQIIDVLTENGKKVILIGSKEEETLLQSISDKCKQNIINSAGTFSIVESVELLNHATLLICNDSAPTHMGMAAGVKTLTLYCSTVPDFGFYPYTNNSYYLSYNELKCKPCGIHGYKHCPISTFECGKKLLPDMVIKKIEEMLVESN